MIRSMTGFGRGGFEVDGVPFEVEIRSVNHRHLDVRMRLPRSLSASESDLKARVQARLNRGKVDASVAVAGGAAAPALEVDRGVVAELVGTARELAAEHGLSPELRLGELLALPGVARIIEREVDEESLTAALDRWLPAPGP